MNKTLVFGDILRLGVLVFYSHFYAHICEMKYVQRKVLSGYSICTFLKKLKNSRHYISLHYKEFIYTKHIVLRVNIGVTGRMFCTLIATAWLCEKMKVNLKIKGASDFFKNDVIVNNLLKYKESSFEGIAEFKAGMMNIAWIGFMYMRSEYGYKILSKLSIKQELKRHADEWFNEHIKGDWVAVHYRGTDVRAGKEGNTKYRYNIELAPYISYLKEVLDEESSIFVCSDQVQFVDKMRVEFPGRVFARDVQRSCDDRALHLDPKYTSLQQKKDSLIDLLILAKADLVYTTGSTFVNITRFLNPSIKIVSLDRIWITKGISIGRRSLNGVPIPRKDLFEKLMIHN